MSPREDSPRWSALGKRLQEPVIAHLMADALARENVLSLGAGFTDNAVLPADMVGEAHDRLRQRPGFPTWLQYGTNIGRSRLRELLCEHLARFPGERPDSFDPARMILTNGSQQALYLAMQVLCDPGDEVWVEAPSYFVFLELLQGLGIQARSLPQTPEGRLDSGVFRQELARAQEENRLPKAIYFMGTYANPSSRCVPAEDKIALGTALQELAPNVFVLEDAAYREMYFVQPWPAPSILSLDAFDGLACLYLGTLTKPFSTGLKTGYATTNFPPLLRKMAQAKAHQDFGSAHFNQCLLEEVLEAGDFARYLVTIRPHYERKMAVLDEALHENGLAESGWRWQRPEGGLLLWAEGPDGLDTSMTSAFCAAALETGVLYVPGDLCFAEGEPKNAVRLSTGALDDVGLREAARRFCAVAAGVPAGA